ncbi:hypothetical protein [Ferruginibacter sp.]
MQKQLLFRKIQLKGYCITRGITPILCGNYLLQQKMISEEERMIFSIRHLEQRGTIRIPWVQQ